MKTPLGKVVLTPNQKDRMSSLHTTNIRGFSIDDKDSVIVYHQTPLTQNELDSLKTALLAIPNEVNDFIKDDLDFATSPFRKITADQADQWIQNNVTDLASAKVAMRKMARVLAYLIRRSNLNGP